MPEFRSVAAMANALQRRLVLAIQSHVPEVVTEVMQDQIDIHVYDAYTPKDYVRTYQLRSADNIVATDVAGGVSIQNVRMDTGEGDPEDIRDVAAVVEQGGPYTWNVSIPPRQFTEETRKALILSRAHVKAARMGLQSQGLMVE